MHLLWLIMVNALAACSTENSLDSYIFDFTWVEGVDTDGFEKGDKVQAIIEGKVNGSRPGTAQVKEIDRIELIK